MDKIILLNSDYSFLNIVDWKKSFTLLVKNKVEVLKYSTDVIKTAAGKFLKIPLIIRLIKLIRAVYRTKVPFSKKNVLIRDGFKCSYCGMTKGNLTIDHIFPRSKGGKSTFENCTAACKKCNNKKGNLTCLEAKMFPNTKLIAPTISEFLRTKMQTLGVDNVLKELWGEI